MAASSELNNLKYIESYEQAELMLHELETLTPLLLLDFGQIQWANYQRLLSFCDEIFIITSPYPAVITKTTDLIQQLSALEFDSVKPLNVISISRARSSISLTMQEMEERLHHTISQVIPAAPEQAYQAELAHRPISMMRANDLVSQQIANISTNLLTRFKEFSDNLPGEQPVKE